MPADNDTPTPFITSKATLASFDHDPLDRHGHGEHCVPGCAPVEVWEGEEEYSNLDGTPVTDPAHLARIHAQRKGV